MLRKNQLKALVASLQQGNLIAFPTETVYALAGDARNLSSVKRLFELKNRPLNQPLSVLLPKNYDLTAWTRDVSSVAQRLADYFWPGPLTLVFHRNESVLPELVGGGNKIGLRVPDHAIAQAILEAFAGGLAAPSANRFANLSSTHADHVSQEFGDNFGMLVDGGACTIGIESTIVDVTTPVPRMLRLGAISQEALQKVIDSDFVRDFPVIPRVKSRFRQVESDHLNTVVFEYLNKKMSIAVLARHAATLVHEKLIWINMPKVPEDYARALYANLREVEKNLPDKILIESLPKNEEWMGLNQLILAKIQQK